MITSNNQQLFSEKSQYYEFPYGIWLPKFDRKLIERISQVMQVQPQEHMNDMLFINGKRVRTQHDSGSHECYNCGHCIDNGLDACNNKKCIRDRKKRKLCDNRKNHFSGGIWIHNFDWSDMFEDSKPHIYEKKGVRFCKEQCRECQLTVKWLVDYPQDYHVIQFNQFSKNQHKVSMKFKSNNRGALGELRHLCFVRDKYKCRECGASNKESVLEVDHIIPFSKGGLTELDNLQILCKKCNRSKHTRTWNGGLDDLL